MITREPGLNFSIGFPMKRHFVNSEFDRPVAVVANRTRQNTNSLSTLLRILTDLETPVISVLRDSQNYLHAADQGLGIYEMPHHRVKKDVAQMDLVIDWLDQLLTRSPVTKFRMTNEAVNGRADLNAHIGSHSI